MLQLPANAVQDVLSHMNNFITGLTPILTLIIGVFLAITAVGLLISYLRK